MKSTSLNSTHSPKRPQTKLSSNTHPLNKSMPMIQTEMSVNSKLNIQIKCFICQQYIVYSCTTQCRHSFCEVCLEEYLIFLNQCPLCLLPARNKKLFYNRVLDHIIEEFIRKYDQGRLENYHQRQQSSRIYKQNRRLAESQLQKGALLDVRDSNYVWGPGKVCNTFFRLTENQQSLRARIKYQHRSLTEQIDPNSQRLAPRGFFSSRQDLPQIKRNQWIWSDSQTNKVYTLQDDINVPPKKTD